MMMSSIKNCAVLVASLLVTGCVSVPKEAGFGSV
jgi:starvation-inducible outer membrane lipoprotein